MWYDLEDPPSIVEKKKSSNLPSETTLNKLFRIVLSYENPIILHHSIAHLKYIQNYKSAMLFLLSKCANLGVRGSPQNYYN